MKRLAGLTVALLVALAPAAVAQQYPPQPSGGAGSAEVPDGTAGDTEVLGASDERVGGGTTGGGGGALAFTGVELAGIVLAGAASLAVGTTLVVRQRRSAAA